MRNAQIEIADIAGQVDSLRQAFEMQMDELRAKQAELAEQLKSVQHSVAGLERKPAAELPPLSSNQTGAVQPSTQPPAKPAAPDGMTEEIMLVIAAAVAAFVGKSARIRSAHYVHEGMSPWAQQGRAFVQASHNLVHHG